MSLKRARRGFTLVETLIALVVLALALVSLAAVPIVTSKLLFTSEEKAKAIMLASSALDLGEAVSYDNACTFNFDIPSEYDNVEERYKIDLDPTGKYQVFLRYLPGCVHPRSVRAEVIWSSFLGKEKSVDFTRDFGPSTYLVVSDDR